MTTATATAERLIVSPDGAEALTFLETSAETGGARTYVEAVLKPGSGTPLHTHATYSEDFEVLEGTLSVSVDGRELHLGPGDRALVPIGAVHRFRNASEAPVRFRCALEPASRGFEEMQQIGAGLAADGRTRGELPKDPRLLGLLLVMSDSGLTGTLRALEPILRALGDRARRRGVEDELRARYVRW